MVYLSPANAADAAMPRRVCALYLWPLCERDGRESYLCSRRGASQRTHLDADWSLFTVHLCARAATALSLSHLSGRRRRVYLLVGHDYDRAACTVVVAIGGLTTSPSQVNERKCRNVFGVNSSELRRCGVFAANAERNEWERKMHC